jgi:hypothetical protein
MDILAAVRAERDRLNKVIALLEGEQVVVSRAAKAKSHGRKWTAAERKAMSLKQKARWAKKKKH